MSLNVKHGMEVAIGAVGELVKRGHVITNVHVGCFKSRPIIELGYTQERDDFPSAVSAIEVDAKGQRQRLMQATFMECIVQWRVS